MGLAVFMMVVVRRRTKPRPRRSRAPRSTPDFASEPKLELPLPRKIKVFDGGWKSDDTKVFDIDKGHTHTHISKYSQVS